MKKLYKYKWHIEGTNNSSISGITEASSISELLAKICVNTDTCAIKSFEAVRLEEVKLEEIEAKWEINCDGWYPYCTNCNYEPDRSEVLAKNGPPEYCPSCGAKMINFKEMQFKGERHE